MRPTWTSVLCIILWSAVVVFGVLGVALLAAKAYVGIAAAIFALILVPPAIVTTRRMEEVGSK